MITSSILLLIWAILQVGATFVAIRLVRINSPAVRPSQFPTLPAPPTVPAPPRIPSEFARGEWRPL